MSSFCSILKILGGASSVAIGEPLNVVSGLCSVATGTMEMKDVVEQFLCELGDVMEETIDIVASYLDNFSKQVRSTFPI